MNMMQDPYQAAAIDAMDPDELPVSPAEEPDDPPYLHITPFEDLLEQYESDEGAAAEVLGGTAMVMGGIGGLMSGGGLAAANLLAETAGGMEEAYAAGLIGSASLYMVGMLAHDIGVDGRRSRGRAHRQMLGYRMTSDEHQDEVMDMLDDADAIWQGEPGDPRDELEWMGRDPTSTYGQVVEDLQGDADTLYQEIAFPSPHSDRFGVLTYADGEPAHLMLGEGEAVDQYRDIGLKIMDNRATYDELSQ